MPGRLAMETGGFGGMIGACPTPELGLSYSFVRLPPLSEGSPHLPARPALFPARLSISTPWGCDEDIRVRPKRHLMCSTFDCDVRQPRDLPAKMGVVLRRSSIVKLHLTLVCAGCRIRR